MFLSTICPLNWLRLATSLPVRGSNSRVKSGFGGAQIFSISKGNNNNNMVHYQWNVRSISSCASPVHAVRTAEIQPLFSSVVKYQIRKHSVVRKGQLQDSLETSSGLEEPLEKPSKLRRPRTKCGLTDNKKDELEASFNLEEPLEKPSKLRTKSKELIGKAPKFKKTRRKLDANSIEEPLESSFHSEEPLEKPSKSRRKRCKVGLIDTDKVYCQLEFDGASKGNPGKAGAGAVLRNQDGSVICELKEGVGRATNNVAEYRAIILGLKVALNKGIQRIHVQGDSMLVCMQIQDLWKTSSQNIAELSKEAKELKSKFKEFHICHIYREFNAEADALANAAIELQNGEIKKVVASFRLGNPLEKASNSRKDRIKVDPVDAKKKLLVSFPSEKPLEKLLKSGTSSCNDNLLDTNKVFYRLDFDGASKGNPGKAGAGAVLRNQDGSVVCKLKEGVGIATNNVAEYRAVILGLKVALSKGIQRIHVQGDSKLVCMQVQDLWKVKSQNIVALNMEAKNLISKFKEFRISHINRELNAEANDLANAAAELQSGEWTK